MGERMGGFTPREASRNFKSGETESPLTPRQREIILHAAVGLSKEESAQQLGLTKVGIASARKRVFDKLGVKGLTEAVLFCLHKRWISPGDVLDELPEGFNVGDKIASLKAQEKNVLDTLTEEGRSDTSNSEIGRVLSLTEKTVKNEMSIIFGKLDISGRVEVAAVYLAATMREREQLWGKLAGVISQEDFNLIVKDSRKAEGLERFRRQLGTSAVFDTLIAGFKKKAFRVDIPTDFSPEMFVDRLSPGQIKLLKQLVANDGRNSRYGKVAEALGIDQKTIPQMLREINDALGIQDINPAILYYVVVGQEATSRSIEPRGKGRKRAIPRWMR